MHRVREPSLQRVFLEFVSVKFLIFSRIVLTCLAQEKNVDVRYLIAKNTIDEQIWGIIQRKMEVRYSLHTRPKLTNLNGKISFAFDGLSTILENRSEAPVLLRTCFSRMNLRAFLFKAREIEKKMIKNHKI